MSELPKHLGGHLNKTHVDRGSLEILKRRFDIKSMLDIGCGPGDMYNIAKDLDIKWYGIDGDFLFKRDNEISKQTAIHDFSKGICYSYAYITQIDGTTWKEFDLAWSVEFLEHVEERYVSNFMAAFKQCKYVIATAAPPGWPGHHHVNCRDQEYWKGVFAANGFEYDETITKLVKENSTMVKPFMQKNGMFFRRYND